MTHECWNCRMLWVDLSDESTKEVDLEKVVFEKFIGAKGLGTYLLCRYQKAGVDPLGPKNILFLLSGPLQGLPAPNVGRWSVVTKSPLTGLYLDSHCGGGMGREIKRAGYDAIGVTGKAKRPVTMVVEDRSVHFESASDIWGKGIHVSTEELRKRSKKGASVYTIGPAGERLRLFSVTSCDIAHQTGRGGVGAVMGSKNLKAVVASGSGSIKAHNLQAIREVNKAVTGSWQAKISGFKDIGTAFLIELANGLGQYPTRNWKDGFFEEHEKLDNYRAEKEFGLGAHQSCPHCIMRCTRAYRTPNPDGSGSTVESTVEYETWGMLGGNIGVSDPVTVMKLNYLCDDLGLDTISAGSAIGFAIEAFQLGMISQKEVGFPLAFGDYECAAKLIRMMASGEGIGEVLSKGVRQASKMIGKGSEKLAVHVKGLESAAWDPRGRKGMGLSYATADVGASHLRGWPATTDPPATSALDVVESMVRARNEKTLTDSLVVCHFTYHLPLVLQQKIALLNAASGFAYDEAAIQLFGRRIDTLSRMFNVREGVSRKDDVLPPKFWIPESQGPRVGMRAFVDEADFKACIDRYYQIRGWDNNGVPTKETIREVGLEGIL